MRLKLHLLTLHCRSLPGTCCNWGNSEAASSLGATPARGNPTQARGNRSKASPIQGSHSMLLNLFPTIWCSCIFPLCQTGTNICWAAITFINRDYHHRIPTWKCARCFGSKCVSDMLVQFFKIFGSWFIFPAPANTLLKCQIILSVNNKSVKKASPAACQNIPSRSTGVETRGAPPWSPTATISAAPLIILEDALWGNLVQGWQTSDV